MLLSGPTSSFQMRVKFVSFGKWAQVKFSKHVEEKLSGRKKVSENLHTLHR